MTYQIIYQGWTDGHVYYVVLKDTGDEYYWPVIKSEILQ